jgi:pyridoxamine 5'-phosphate oxidase
VEEISRTEAEATWRARAKGHQLGTLASRQSLPLKDRRELSRRHAELTRAYATREVPCPPTWVGYRIVPDEIEFWERGTDRLHAREVYTRGRGGWRRELLNP